MLTESDLTILEKFEISLRKRELLQDRRLPPSGKKTLIFPGESLPAKDVDVRYLVGTQLKSF